MTLAKAKLVAAAILDAGYNATIQKLDVDSWKVRATSQNMDISVGNANSLATAQSVSAMIAEVEYF